MSLSLSLTGKVLKIWTSFLYLFFLDALCVSPLQEYSEIHSLISSLALYAYIDQVLQILALFFIVGWIFPQCGTARSRYVVDILGKPHFLTSLYREIS